MPSKPGTNKKPPASKAMTAREMWLQALKGRNPSLVNKKAGLSTTKKTPNEFWVGSLRKSQGLQNEIASMDTFGSHRPADEAVPYLSTSHYLRERVGVEKSMSHKRSSSVTDLRAAPGTPAYKTPEEYYDEVLELRKVISTLDKDASLLRAKLRRVEEDNTKKEKEIESLMDPTKSGDLRRTLTDRKPESSAVVHSLKQRVMRLEQQLKDKEQIISAHKNDLKATNIEEVRLQMEMFYQEIVRLQSSKGVVAPVSAATSSAKGSKSKEVKESSSKIKALNDTILRMNEKNVRLTTENKALKEDLENLMSKTAETKERQSDYEDLSRKQLANMLAKLEMKLEAQNQIPAASKPAADDMSSVSSFNTKRSRPDVSTKLELEGSLAERLELLDKRESELMDYVKHQTSTIKKLREERQLLKQKSDEKTKEIKSLKKEIADLCAELELYYEKDKADKLAHSRRSSVVTNRENSSARKPNLKDRPPSPRERLNSARSRESDKLERERRDKRLTEIRENQAARTIQKGWRKHHDYELQRDRERRLEEFTNNRAAKKIQNQWLKHQHHKNEKELDEAALLIQSAWRGNVSRRKQIEQDLEEEDEEELEDAATLIQSTMRGHWARKQYMNSRSRTSSYNSELDYISDEERNVKPRQRTGSNSRTSSRPPSVRSTTSLNRSQASLRSKQALDSAGEEENTSDEILTPRQRPKSAKRTPTKRPPSARKASPALVQSDDDDDDVVF